MKKGLITKIMLTTALMLCVMFFFTADAKAALPDGVYVAGTRVDTGGTTYWLNDGTGGITATGASESRYNVKYEEPGTLTLKGAILSKDCEAVLNSDLALSTILYSQNACTIVLKENNTITGKDVTAKASDGLLCLNYLTIRGDGSLNVSGGNTTGDCRSSGIVGSRSITFGEEVHVTATSLGFGVAISSGSGTISVNDSAEIFATCLATTHVYSYTSDAIYANFGFTVNGGVVHADNQIVQDNSRGVYCIYGTTTVNSGTLEVWNKGNAGAILTGPMSGCLNSLVCQGSVSATASTAYTGEGAAEYQSSENATYRYVRASDPVITVTVSPENGGTVTGDGPISGGVANLSATPNSNYTFVGWYEGGGLIIEDPGLTLTNVTADRNLTAVFQRIPGTETNTGYVQQKVNTYILDARYTVEPDTTVFQIVHQGSACVAVFKNAIPNGYEEAFSFNMVQSGKTTYNEKENTIVITIPQDLISTGRVFEVIGADNHGKAHIFKDLDQDVSTVTINVEGFEGYAFDLIYADGVGEGIYVVQKGDSLSVIARKLGMTVKYLVEKNGIKDPNKIRVEEKIYF